MANSKNNPAQVKNEQPVNNAPATDAPAKDAPATDAPAKVVKIESVEVLKLRGDKSAKLLEQKAAFVNDDFELGQKLGLEVFAIQKSIDAQITLEAQKVRELELQEKRNAKIALIYIRDEKNAEYETFAKGYFEKVKNETRTEDDKLQYDVIETARNTAHENLVNAVLGSVPSIAKAKVDNGIGETSKGGNGTSAEIERLLNVERAAGKTIADAKKAVEAQGYSRGTTGAVCTKVWPAGAGW